MIAHATTGIDTWPKAAAFIALLVFLAVVLWLTYRFIHMQDAKRESAPAPPDAEGDPSSEASN